MAGSGEVSERGGPASLGRSVPGGTRGALRPRRARTSGSAGRAHVRPSGRNPRLRDGTAACRITVDRTRPVIAPRRSRRGAFVTPEHEDAPRLVFVQTAGEAGPPRDGCTYVVLDTAWTPQSADHEDVVPVRRAISAILKRHDLFDEALDRLDPWAAEAGLDDAMLADGVAWWYRLRPVAWYALHEAILWRRVIGELEDDGPAAVLEVPAGRPLLEAAARAVGVGRGTAVVVTPAEAPGSSPASGSTLAVAGARSARPAVQHRRPLLIRMVSASTVACARTSGVPLSDRSTRTARSGRDPPDRVRGWPGYRPSCRLPSRASSRWWRAWPPSEWWIRGSAPVLDRLRNRQRRPIVVVGLEARPSPGLGLAVHRRRSDPHPGLLPSRALGSAHHTDVDSAEVAARVAAIAVPPSSSMARTLSPLVVEVIGRSPPRWLDGQRRLLRQASGSRRIRPVVLFLNHEGFGRLGWPPRGTRDSRSRDAEWHHLSRASPSTGTRTLARPSRFRTLPASTAPTSARSCFSTAATSRERWRSRVRRAWTTTDGPTSRRGPGGRTDAVRGERRRRDGDRLLVVSTANLWIVRDVHVVDMIARTLGGPLPCSRRVQAHPGEADKAHIATLMPAWRAPGDTPPRLQRGVGTWTCIASCEPRTRTSASTPLPSPTRWRPERRT